MLGRSMEAEIREQPNVLRRNTSWYFEELHSYLSSRKFEMILLAARGSSDHAALYARYLFEIELQIPVVLAAPSVLTRFGSQVRYPSCLAIGISQSGAAPDVAEVLEVMRASGHTTLAITNTKGSRLSEAAEFTLDLGAGAEVSVAATKTYTASLLALHQAARALGGPIDAEPELLPDDAWCQSAHDAAAVACGGLLRSNIVFALGRAYDFATAFETALKLMECALIPCKPYSTADFQHGPRALASHGAAAIVFGEPQNYLADQGSLAIQAPQAPVAVPLRLRPLWDIFFGQWLALHAARARGLDPDDPQFLEKVTKTY